MEKEIRPLWELLILSRDQEKPAALNCEECMLLMEYDADLLSAGASQEEIIHIVNQHLSICSTCRDKFDDWLDQYSRYNSSEATAS